MSHWTAPPDSLAPEMRHLVDQLRAAKDRTRLSYTALAARTAVSRSSWERYLNGKTLPPRQAVEALAKVSGADLARLLALWELADRAWSGRDDQTVDRCSRPAQHLRAGPGTRDDGHSDGKTRPAPPPAAPGGPDRPVPSPGRGRMPVRLLAVTGVALVLTVVLSVGAWALLRSGSQPSEAEPSAGPCRGAACTGRDPEGKGIDCWAYAGTYAVREVAGRVVELRVSKECRAAWARLLEPRPGDRVRVDAGKEQQSVEAAVRNRIMYTMMVGGIESPSQARACFRLADGRKGCTVRGSTRTVPGAGRPSAHPGGSR